MPTNEAEGNYAVYVHLFPNGKRYVGITCRPVNRRWENGSGYANQPYMARAIKKYGWENISHTILHEHMTLKEAARVEVELIKLWGTNNPRLGYNVDNGGLTCGKHSEKTRAKISANRKGKCIGESNCKFGVDMRGENNPFYGKKHSQDATKKMSAAHKKRNTCGANNTWAKPVVCGGVEFGSVVECSNYYGVHRDVLSGYLSGGRKISRRFIDLGLRYAEVNKRCQ